MFYSEQKTLKKLSLAGLALLAVCIAFFVDRVEGKDKPGQPDVVRIGYFHGGRTRQFYRAYVNKYFEKEKIRIRLFTKTLRKQGLLEAPETYEEWRAIERKDPYYGDLTGPEIVDAIVRGELDGGTIGEASFLLAVNTGAPIVAVSNMGHIVKGEPAYAIVLRKEVKAARPEDLKGRTFISRLSGPLDNIMIRSFVESEGLKLSDVKFIDEVFHDEQFSMLKTGKADGGFFHLHMTKKFIKSDVGYIYRKFDWINPEAATGILVFHRDFVKNNRDVVQRVVNAYVKRIKYENSLSPEEKKNPKDNGPEIVDYTIAGMNLPQADYPPKLRPDMLNLMQDLMLKYGEIKNRVDSTPQLDFSFVEKAAANKD